MCRLPAGTGRRIDAVAADGGATLVAPTHFAPGDDNCTITYQFRRSGRLAGAQVSLKIQDRNDAVIYESRLLGLAADRRDQYIWDGKDADNNLVTPHNSPYTVTLKVGNLITRTRQVRVEVRSIAVWTRQPSRIYMNRPESPTDFVATVILRRTNNSQAVARMPVEVKWSFDEHGTNTAAVSTHQYISAGNKRLGKKGNATAVHWAAHANCTGTTESDDTYYQTCRVKTITTAGVRRGKAYVKFKPSSLGGDQFRIRAKVMYNTPSNDLVARAGRSNYIPIWRKVRFTASEMQSSGQRHVSTHGSEAVMNGYFTGNNTFVKYELGTVSAINATYCVKYIGLWDHAHTRMDNWSTVKRKQAGNGEAPTADDITKANTGRHDAASITARDQARARIKTCAENWRDRIITAYTSGLNNWAPDASVARNTVVAVEYEHPKYSANAPNADSVTSEWSGRNFSWLRIRIEGHDIHPDRRWVNGQGLSHQGRAYIMAGMSAARTRVVIAHEIGHETRNQFKRHNFRPRSSAGRPQDSDHTPGSGLMYWTGNRNNFTNGEKQILRGFDNP